MICFRDAMNEPLNAYPNVSAWRDRHGRTRWRFRRSGKTIYLPGEPFTEEFYRAYQAAIAGLPILKPAKPKPAPVVRIATATIARSMRAAWRSYIELSPDWQACEPITRQRQTAIAEAFLAEPIIECGADVWGDMPIADLKRRHVKMILSRMSDRPFAARFRLNVIRKMIEAALDEEWIEADPTHKLKYRPERIKGHRPWTDEERSAYEMRWAPGSTPRLVYEIALWLGNRRADIASLRWDQRGEWSDSDSSRHDVFRLTQSKTRKSLILPVTPSLAECLAATERRGETVVVTQYGQPFSVKSLTGRMADWTRSAKIAPGCTLHGLRKTLGRVLGESDATTRQLMEILGHDDIAHAELYSREASQARLAVQGMEKAVASEKRRKLRVIQGG